MAGHYYYSYYSYYYYYHACTQHLDPSTTARIPQAKQHRGHWVLQFSLTAFIGIAACTLCIVYCHPYYSD